MVVTWFTWHCDDVTVNNADAVDRWLRCWCEAAGKWFTVWINSGSRRIFLVDMQLLDSQMARWNHTCFASKCGHPIMMINPTPCKIVQTSGQVTGSHFDRAVNSPHWISIKEIYFELNSVSRFCSYCTLFIIDFSLWQDPLKYFEWLPLF